MSGGEVFIASDSADIEQQLHTLGPADVVVGIPSYREADNIAHVVRQVDIGLREYFAGSRCAIVNADNNSEDGTREAFLTAGSRTPLVYISTPDDVRGKGNNFYNLFQAARLLDAKAVAAVDADLMSITPQWIRNLVSPILDEGCDLVTPVYARNEYDGSITNHICYPLLCGLLGREVRQPIGGDFGFSTRFTNHLLERKWRTSTRQYGIDIFLTVNALLGAFSVAQTSLGAKVHKPSAPKLGPMFTQVVTTLFSHLTGHRDQWSAKGATEPVPRFDGIEVLEPQPLALDYKGIKRTAQHQYAKSRQALSKYLLPRTFSLLDEMMESDHMRLGPTDWSHVVYDLLFAFHQENRSRMTIVEALKPVFFVRSASFYRRTLDLDHASSEAEIVNQARIFRRQRKYLFEKY